MQLAHGPEVGRGDLDPEPCSFCVANRVELEGAQILIWDAEVELVSATLDFLECGLNELGLVEF